MPTLEIEIGVAVILAVTAGGMLASNKASGDDTPFHTLLLMSTILQCIITSYFPLSTSLRLTESYTRWRVPPIRSYWAGAFHALGAASLTASIGAYVVMFLSSSGFTALLSQHVWGGWWRVDDEDLEVNVGDLLALLVLFIVVFFVGWRTKQREMDPETEMVAFEKDRVTAGGGQAGGAQGGERDGRVWMGGEGPSGQILVDVWCCELVLG